MTYLLNICEGYYSVCTMEFKVKMTKLTNPRLEVKHR